jgi:hypothetical protein
MKYLLSYPRSGNTFLRYCLEYITEHNTSGCAGDSGLINRGELNIKPKDKTVQITKRHFSDPNRNNDLYLKDSIKKENVLIFLRDYKYCVNSQILRGSGMKAQTEIKKYCRNINSFYNEDNIFYYEDFIEDPKKIVKDILEFYKISYDLKRFESFFKNFDDHKQKSLKLYKKRHKRIINSSPKKDQQSEWNKYALKWIDNDKKHVIERYL